MAINMKSKQREFEKFSARQVDDLFAGGECAPVKPKQPLTISKVKKKRIDEIVCVDVIEPPRDFEKIGCPMCGQIVNAPSVEMIIEHFKIPKMEARVLTAIWEGNGKPVSAQKIFDAMYEDDINGGPADGTMYNAFKVCLFKLRRRLEGIGISIVNSGYGRGYRLVIGEMKNG